MPKKSTVTTKKVIKKPVKKEVEIKVVKEAPQLPIENLIEPVVPVAPVIKEKYYEAMGRRKESIARVRMYTKKATDIIESDKALVIVNNKDYRDYFSDSTLWEVVEAPLKRLKSLNRFKATVVVRGGGKSGQADAIKQGIARTLVLFDQNFRKKLRKAGYLTRDPRAKERRKYGLKKARKAPRWAKR